MEPFNYVKNFVLNYRFESCCCIAPVRVGLIILEFLSVFSQIVCVLGTSNESFNSTFMVVQSIIMEDSGSKSVPMLVYMIDMCFSVLCLCAILRKDAVLLRLFMYYCVAMLVLSIMFYSIVIAAIDVLTHIAIICEIIIQIYVLLLVRSAIVELKWENKQSVLPTLVMRSQVYEKKPQNDEDMIKNQNKILGDETEPQNYQDLNKIQTKTQKNKKEPQNDQDSIKNQNGNHKEPTKEENIGNQNICDNDDNKEKATIHNAEPERKNDNKNRETKLETVNEEPRNV